MTSFKYPAAALSNLAGQAGGGGGATGWALDRSYIPVTPVESQVPGLSSPDIRGSALLGDLSKVYFHNRNTGNISEALLGTPGDLSSGLTVGSSISESSSLANGPLHITSDGAELYMLDINTEIVHWTLSTPGDLSTAGSPTTLSPPPGNSGIFVPDNGDKIIILGFNAGLPEVTEIPLSTSHDLSTAGAQTSTTYNFPGTLIATNFFGVSLKPEGDVLAIFLLENDTNTRFGAGIAVYDLSTPFDTTSQTLRQLTGVAISNGSGNSMDQFTIDPAGERYWACTRDGWFVEGSLV